MSSVSGLSEKNPVTWQQECNKLVETCISLFGPVDEEAICKGIIEVAFRHFACDAAYLHAISARDADVIHFSVRDESGSRLSGQVTKRVFIAQNMLVSFEKHPSVMVERLTGKHARKGISYSLESRYSSGIYIPLLADDTMLGTLCLKYRDMRTWNRGALEYAASAGRIIGTLVYCARMARRSLEKETRLARERSGMLVYGDSVRMLSSASCALPRCPRSDRPTYALTRDEKRLVALVARGMSNREIGEVLYLSPATVKKHLSGVMRKLHLDNRVQVAVFATEAGID